MDWNNVNLADSYERDQNILDPLSFDTLLLEISCNIKKDDLTEAKIREQFEIDLQNRIRESREIFNANLKNILNQAKKERSAK